MKTEHNINKEDVIDIHCHTAGIGAGDSGCYISPALRKSWKYRFYLRAFGVEEDTLHIQGDSSVIKKLSTQIANSAAVGSAVVLAMDGVVNARGELDHKMTEIYIPNDFVAEETAKYDNLHFGASINPYRVDAVEKIQEAASNNAVLIKWLPSIQGIDPADSRLVPFYLRLKECGLPLLTHTGNEHSFTKSDNSLSDPCRLRLPLEIGVTVIAAHAATNGRNGGVNNFERILPMFARYPNLYADISSLTQVNKIGHLSRLLRHHELHEKLLYGTDMPLLKTGISSPLFFAHRLGIREALTLRGEANPWDQDVALKLRLGVPSRVFTRASKLFKKGSSTETSGRNEPNPGNKNRSDLYEYCR